MSVPSISQSYLLGLHGAMANISHFVAFTRVTYIQTGVQQGDPLGPFMFALVLQRMVTTLMGHVLDYCTMLGIWMMVPWRVNLHQC